MNNDFFRDVSKLFVFLLTILRVVVSGGNVNYAAAGGYGDDYQNTGGAKQQLFTLIRSVRTVMRGKIQFILFILLNFSFSSFDCI
jgi:hypothetical protein